MHLKVSDPKLARILGMNPRQIARIRRMEWWPTQHSSVYESCLLFMRLWVSLGAIVGDDRRAASWLHSRSPHIPARRVVDYLDKPGGLAEVVALLESRYVWGAA